MSSKMSSSSHSQLASSDTLLKFSLVLVEFAVPHHRAIGQWWPSEVQKITLVCCFVNITAKERCCTCRYIIFWFIHGCMAKQKMKFKRLNLYYRQEGQKRKLLNTAKIACTKIACTKINQIMVHRHAIRTNELSVHHLSIVKIAFSIGSTCAMPLTVAFITERSYTVLLWTPDTTISRHIIISEGGSVYPALLTFLQCVHYKVVAIEYDTPMTPCMH